MLLQHRVLLILTVLSFLSTLYLYLYPFFHGCHFPQQDASLEFPEQVKRQHQQQQTVRKSSTTAPFRLLTLGDPQLEGDSSLPKLPRGPSLEKLWQEIRLSHSWGSCLQKLRGISGKILFEEIPLRLVAWRKQLDLLGNDWYLAHIYRTMHWYTQPTHVTVLGDLLGSQWIDDVEFQRRSNRFWRRVMRDSQRVDDTIMATPAYELLGQDLRWNRRIINVVGNHDVGYAGDMTEAKVERFEREFGRVNWEISFYLPKNDSSDHMEASLPSLRIIIFNTMNLDTPAKSPTLQTDTYDFLNAAILRSAPVEDRSVGTILLTHIPLHKAAGVCVDAPYMALHPSHAGAGIKEQNHLSYDAGQGILEGIFGMSHDRDGPGAGRGRTGIILTGHDHEGCDVYHHLWRGAAEAYTSANKPEEAKVRWWNASRWTEAAAQVADLDVPGVREITVRSMMGDFGGNAGLLSAWFDDGRGEWQFAFANCRVGVQHLWWAVHVLLLVTMGMALWVGWMMLWRWSLGKGESSGVVREEKKQGKEEKTVKEERKVKAEREARKARKAR